MPENLQIHYSYLPLQSLMEQPYLHSFVRANKLVLTANDNSIGNSGGTTEVKISVHSKNNLQRFLFGSSVPEKLQENKVNKISNQTNTFNIYL